MNKTIRLFTTTIAAILAVTLTGCQQLPKHQDLTIALTATSADPAPDLGSLTSLVRDHADAALLPGDGEVTVVTLEQAKTVDLTPMRGREVEAVEAKRKKLFDANFNMLQDILSNTTASKDGLDVIGTLDRALEQTPEGGHVVLESSAYSTVAPMDLNKAGNWIGNPDGFVQAVNRDDLPNAKGKHITFIGVGYTNPVSNQEQAGPAARTALAKILLGICTKMEASSCNILTGPAGQEPSTSTNDVPVISLNQITTHCVGQTNIDASIAFGPNERELLPAADPILAPIAESLSRCPNGTVINATGHSAIVPGTIPDQDLERDRAQAILDRLITLGAPESSIGTATAGGQIIDNLPGGTFNETLAAKNRTVTLNIG